MRNRLRYAIKCKFVGSFSSLASLVVCQNSVECVFQLVNGVKQGLVGYGMKFFTAKFKLFTEHLPKCPAAACSMYHNGPVEKKPIYNPKEAG